MQPRTITTRRGQTCESSLTDAEAQGELVKLVRAGKITGTFGQSLAGKIVTSAALSAEQVAWCHILVVQFTKGTGGGLKLERILGLIQRGLAAKLKSPTVRALWKGHRLQVKHRTGGHYKGKALITDGEKYPNTITFGTLDADGARLFATAPTWLAAALEALDADPESMARAYGRLTSACCFCARALSTPESLAMGYGPDCAETYGLPWGEAKVDTLVNLFDLEDKGQA